MKMTGLRLQGLTTINLPLHGALPSDQFILKGVDGLGPVGRNVSIARGVHRRSEYTDREISALVGLGPNWSTGQTAGHLRDILYGLLTPAVGDDVITIEILDGNTVVAITRGVVRLIEPAMFTKDPVVQITIPCLEPNLTAPAESHLALTGNTPVVNNVGTVAVGFLAEFVLGPVTYNLSMYTASELKNKIEFMGGAGVKEGDQVKIDTRNGAKVASLRRTITNPTTGVATTSTINLVDHMTDLSVWPKLLPGSHPLIINQPVTSWVDFAYTPHFLGV